MTHSSSARFTLATALCLAACNEATAPAVRAHLTAVTPTELTGTVATEVSPAPTVRVTDVSGAAVAGVQVTFDVIGGGGTVTPRIVETDAEGSAATAWMLDTIATRYRIAAQVANAAPVVFSAVATPGPLARLDVIDGDMQMGAPNSPLPQRLIVRVGDAFANPIADATVSFDAVSGGGRVEPATAITDSSGLARSGTWTLGASAGWQEVRARIEALEVGFNAEAFGLAPQHLQLAFVSLEDGQIYTISLDGGPWRRLTNEGRNVRPAWSPDGRRIAFVRHDDYVADIYVMNADGSNVIRRTTHSNFWSAAWSPDGRKLAVSTEGLYFSAIWIISADEDGSNPVHLALDARSPAWSPDGEKIAYIRPSGDDGYDAIYVMNADGTGATPLTERWGARYGLTWSPDGRRIASSHCVLAACDLFSMNADGSDVRRLTDVGTVQDAAWSPDGAWIAVSLGASWGGDRTASLFYVPAGGGTPRLVAAYASGPSWRP